jgi:hypothetical protein
VIRRLVVDEVEVQIVRVNLRNRDLRQRGGHVYTSVVSDMTFFKPGEVKSLEISENEVAEIKRHRNGAWELVTAAPSVTAADDDVEDMHESTSSEASAVAAAAEQAEAELLDPPPRIERVQRVQRKTRT